MVSTLLLAAMQQADLCGERWVALVDLSQPVQHFGQLRRVDGLHCNLYHRRRVELERPENLSLKQEMSKT